MLSIKNKEQEECDVLVVDINGNVCYENHIKPLGDIEIDLNRFLAGIYTLIFKTTHTSFVQQIVKYG
jgi:hypothetical protein